MQFKKIRFNYPANEEELKKIEALTNERVNNKKMKKLFFEATGLDKKEEISEQHYKLMMYLHTAYEIGKISGLKEKGE